MNKSDFLFQRQFNVHSWSRNPRCSLHSRCHFLHLQPHDPRYGPMQQIPGGLYCHSHSIHTVLEHLPWTLISTHQIALRSLYIDTHKLPFLYPHVNGRKNSNHENGLHLAFTPGYVVIQIVLIQETNHIAHQVNARKNSEIKNRTTLAFTPGYVVI